MNKHLLLKSSAFLLCSLIVGGITHAAGDIEPSVVSEDEATYGLHKTLEYNFSPEDRARLRKALADFSRNTDPEHVQIQKKRKVMQTNLKERFNNCDNDLDEALSRQEATECLPQIARHFNYVDVDEDNVITFGELELAQDKWTERRKAADAKVEAERLKQLEAELKEKGKRKIKKQASSVRKQPG